MNYQTPSLRRALAADYAVGVMPALARRRFERLLLEDMALRVELAQWQACLVRMTETVPEQPVPGRVWQKIQARLEPQQKPSPSRRPFWNWLRTSVAVCSLALAVVFTVIYNTDDSRYSATLLSDSAQPAFRVDAFEKRLEVQALALSEVSQAQSLELWAIAEGNKPVSLGLISATGTSRIELNNAQRLLISKPVVLAVSLEPKGGSSTGQPTGPVLYKGALADL